MPSPVKNRVTASISTEPVIALASDATPKINRLAINSGFRPKRSPIGPAERAPTMIPMLDHKNAVVKAGPGRFQACVIPADPDPDHGAVAAGITALSGRQR